jgi:hypothetical protein
MTKLIFSLISLTAVSGCAFQNYHYYEPLSAEGDVKSFMCSGTVGPPEVLVIKKDTIQFRIHVSEKTNKDIVLVIYFKVPDGNFVKNPVDTFYLVKGGLKIEATDRTLYYRDIEYDLTEIEYSGTHTANYQVLPSTKKRDNRGYQIQARFKNVDFTTFRVLIPPFQINGKTYEFPSVQFKKSEKVIISPLNC